MSRWGGAWACPPAKMAVWERTGHKPRAEAEVGGGEELARRGEGERCRPAGVE